MIQAFPQVSHRIPPCFSEKIEWDNRVDEIKKGQTPSFSEYKEARDQQELSRYSCIHFIRIQRGSGGVGGSGRG
jgi:L-lysine 2,3-aminomutase